MKTLKPKAGVVAEHLKRFALFEGLGDADLAELAERALLRRYDTGASIFL